MAEITFSPFPSYGEIYALKEFMERVEEHLFIDYDGHGYLATATQMSSVMIKPSMMAAAKAWNLPLAEWATHVIWFNR